MASPAARRQSLLRTLPSVDEFLRSPGGLALLARFPRPAVLAALRGSLAAARAALRSGKASAVSPDALACAVEAAAEADALPGVRRAVNATGVILHTGLGRAPLAESALAAMVQAGGSCTLEIDAASGERGQRDARAAALLCRLTGAEAALVVNNNAAATLLLLNAMAKGKDVIVSRGELVEIGGSYRMPDIMAASGVRMVEVGTTNKTHLADYARAVRKETGLLLKVHTSNYRVVGFHEEVSLGDLVALGRKRRIPVAHDLGSGALMPLAPFGLADEPRVSESLKAGVAAVCFSADKLLGGPQAGILLGRKKEIDAMRRNPLARALRVGKLTLAALEATLRLYEEPDRLAEALPVWRMLSARPEELQRRAEALARILGGLSGVEAAVKPSQAQVGSGTVPAQELESRAVALSVRGVSAAELARRFRAARVPVFSRVQGGKVWLDLRTLPAADEPLVVEALRGALG
jgi:L-seryl-tRNA(Ser) seleniumtransferase